MGLMSPMDSMFLLMESREHPMHVGGLSLFSAPERDPGGAARRLYEDLTAGGDELSATFRRRPGRLLAGFSALQWDTDDDVDIDYHVRLLSLPAPGRVRELLELVSMLHGALLDRHRPLWEAYVIDGLADGRIALYVKTHHALMDGISTVRTWQRALASEADDRGCVPPWYRVRRPAPGPPSLLTRSLELGRTARRIGASVPQAVTGAYELARDYPQPRPFQAPDTMFNVPITGARRFAAQSWPLERLRAVATRTGATLNDVVLAMCAGALRAYLTAADALPDEPLIAMVPVSLRAAGESTTEAGNSVGAALCDLATDSADPAERLARIRAAMTRAKAGMAKLTSLQMLGVSAVNVAGLALPALPIPLPRSAPPFNIVISNVPGAEEPRYWNGLRLEAVYPASIPLDGQAVNITTVSSGGAMHFGIVGCRRTVPRLQQLLTGLDQALLDLENTTV
ncbi:wax ester/triacylglycerol synthase family O-acyltransferase [Nocardia sp. AG03]|uniref:WS/DGAT/MGAT family O-acyltransferase n=1 Tax=Nocardia sp. AG03 TaxID=3025312 RepID=UPI00241816FF|nr:wax ester/triacylglycerol synthase family O-acyltransferase [Nocardia sp. AG03]